MRPLKNIAPIAAQTRRSARHFRRFLCNNRAWCDEDDDWTRSVPISAFTVAKGSRRGIRPRRPFLEVMNVLLPGGLQNFFPIQLTGVEFLRLLLAAGYEPFESKTDGAPSLRTATKFGGKLSFLIVQFDQSGRIFTFYTSH